MEVPSDGGADPERVLGAHRPEPTLRDLDNRLAALERGLVRTTSNLQAVADSLEATIGALVATEVKAAAGDLRHAMSELGRILVRDVGRLPQMLAQHRREIVTELTEAIAAAPAQASPLEGSVVDEPPTQPPTQPPPSALADEEPDQVAADEEPEAATGAEEPGRRWRSRRRHQDQD